MNHSIDHFDQMAALVQQDGMPSRLMDLWVRGEDVAVYEVDMPDVAKRRWADMVPWLLEDQLLRPAEELHFVVGPTLPNNRALIYVVARETMNRWLMMAESKSISVQKMVPDYLALPLEDGYWTLGIHEQRMLVRTGENTGFAADVDLGWQLLELELERSDDVRITAILDDDLSIPEKWREQISAQQGEINWSFVELPGLNLLSGDYKPKNVTELGPWLPSMGLAACALLLMLVYMLVQSYQWQKDLVVVEAGVASAYEGLFNENWQGPTANVRDAAEQRMQLLEHQYVVLQSTPLYELRLLDSLLSSCTGCDLQLLEQQDDSLNLDIKPVENLISRLNAVPGLSLDSGTPDDSGVVRLTISREANDG